MYSFGTRTNRQILRWWELRRILFNIVLFTVMIGSLYVIGINVFDSDLSENKHFIFMMLLIYIFTCNVMYTLGALTEMKSIREFFNAVEYFTYTLLASLGGMIVFVATVSVLVYE